MKLKLSSILSVRNVLRFSGIVALTVGAPLALAPGPSAVLFFGRRKLASEAEKAAISVTLRALGIALVGNAASSLTAPVEKKMLAPAVGLEGMYMLYHWLNRFTGKWKNADGVMQTNLFFAFAASTMVLLQTASLCIGDEPAAAEAKDVKVQATA